MNTLYPDRRFIQRHGNKLLHGFAETEQAPSVNRCHCPMAVSESKRNIVFIIDLLRFVGKKSRKTAGFIVIQGNPLVCHQPQRARSRGEDLPDYMIVNTAWSASGKKGFYSVAVVTVQSVPGAKPYISFGIPRDGIDRAVAQPFAPRYGMHRGPGSGIEIRDQ